MPLVPNGATVSKLAIAGPSNDATGMATFVLVHGGYMDSATWNQLTHSNDYPKGERLGGSCWRLTETLLLNAGHSVYAPDLLDEYSHSLTEHVNQVCDIISQEDLHGIVLVGHSYGGMVITGIAAQVPERIRQMVYLEANVPDPGQSLFDILGLAGFEPEKVIEGTPSAYVEKISYNPEALERLDRSYIRCTESDFLSVTEIMVRKIDFDRGDWKYFELPTSHSAQVTMPAGLNDILQSLIVQQSK